MHTKVFLLIGTVALSGCRVIDPNGQAFFENLKCGISLEKAINVSLEYGGRHSQDNKGIHDFVFSDEQFVVYFTEKDKLSGVDRTVVKRYLWQKELESFEIALKCSENA